MRNRTAVKLETLPSPVSVVDLKNLFFAFISQQNSFHEIVLPMPSPNVLPCRVAGYDSFFFFWVETGYDS